MKLSHALESVSGSGHSCAGPYTERKPGIEGLLHVSQLSRGTVENVAEVVHEGETHLLRIVNIDKKRQRMGLSLKAVTAMEQIEWMAQREIEKAAAEAEAEALAEATADAEEITTDGEVDSEATAEMAAALDADLAVEEE